MDDYERFLRPALYAVLAMFVVSALIYAITRQNAQTILNVLILFCIIGQTVLLALLWFNQKRIETKLTSILDMLFGEHAYQLDGILQRLKRTAERIRNGNR